MSPSRYSVRPILFSSIVAGALVGASLSYPVRAEGPPNGLSVTVTNTPLPVTVDNFPATSTVSGSVSITGTPNVHVTNGTNSPVPVREVDRSPPEPFQASQLIVNNFPNGWFDHVTLATVPQDKRLVVEFASVSAELPAGQRLVKVLVSVFTNGILSAHRLVVSPQGRSFEGTDDFVASQAVRLYADPDTRVIVSFFRDTDSNEGSISLSVTGHLEDAF